MDKRISNTAEEGLEKIVKYILQSSRPLSLEKIYDIFYNIMADVYTIILQDLRNIYHEVKSFEVKDIMELTYREDGKTVEDRI